MTMRLKQPGKTVLFGICLAGLYGLTLVAQQNWTHFARIGGHSLSLDKVDSIIRSATASHVYGIETDNDIPGRYESFLDPAEKLRAIKAVAEKAHAAGNKAFVYIAGLECITANAAKSQHSFYKDHPDWVQRKITGEPAIFGGGSAFWIREGDEDVWISPYAAEWRKIYMGQVRQIAETGIDGIYVDIPYWMTHFDGWEDTWASFDDYTVAAFKEKSGLNAKKDIKLGDFTDVGFRRWVDFRIQSLTDFMKEIDANVKAVNPQCMTIAEIYPGIEEPAVRVGTDVYQLYKVVDVIAHEYEYDSGNHMAASKTPLDWFGHLIGMYSFRAFAGGKASWMLNYSWDGEKKIDPKEAMKNLFMAQLMAGTNVWDARGHVMSGSNDMETRKLVFQWIAQHEKTFYRPRLPIRPLGVYFSPQTRNYFALGFMESYRGIMCLLLQAHLEFQIVTPRDLNSFTGGVLILPDVRCLGEKELSALASLSKLGTTLVVTGQTGNLDEQGEARSTNPLHKLLGIDKPAERASRSSQPKYLYDPNCPGRAYFKELSKGFDALAIEGNYQGASFDKLKTQFVRNLKEVSGFSPSAEIKASPFIATQIARVDGKIHVFFANFRGLKSKEVSEQIPERDVTITFPAKRDTIVHCLPFLGKVEELKGVYEKGKISCVIPEIQKGLVVWWE